MRHATCVAAAALVAAAGMAGCGGGDAAAPAPAAPTTLPPPAATRVSDGVRQAPGGSLRQAVETFARQHGIRLVVDPMVRLDGQPPGPADGPAEATLRTWLAGYQLLLHLEPDATAGVDRLRTVWVFARGTPLPGPDEVRSASSRHLATVRAAAAGDPAAPGEPAAPSLAELWRVAQQGSSDADRMQALDALVAQSDADPAMIDAVLDRLASDEVSLLGEHARALRESRAAPSADEPLEPEPIE